MAAAPGLIAMPPSEAPSSALEAVLSRTRALCQRRLLWLELDYSV